MRMMPRWMLLLLLMLLMLLLTEDLVLPMVNIPKPMADGASAPTLPHIFGSRWMQLDARGGFELRYGAGRPDGAVQPDARGSGA